MHKNSQLEESGGKGALTDDDVKSMLKQAIGLARFMGREHVVEALTDILNDPGTVSAIRDDAVTRGILRKILVMRRLACRDSAKKKKLDKLEKYSSRKYHEEDDSSDSSLRRFIDQSEALTRGPVGSRLKKSKSMVKKSKSMIMTAKDIPMNAFLAMKNTADEKDERWLQNFLSESVIEDVPWECSKALIILKEGFQAIIPREASRSILLGEASYTLIDDNGIEFYLSPADKKRREMREGDEELRPSHSEVGDKKANEEEEASMRSEMTNASSDKKSLRDVLEADPLYQSAVQARQEEVIAAKYGIFYLSYVRTTILRS